MSNAEKSVMPEKRPTTKNYGLSDQWLCPVALGLPILSLRLPKTPVTRLWLLPVRVPLRVVFQSVRWFGGELFV